MRRRLLALLLVAAASGTAAGVVSSARAGKPAAAAARVPALPPVPAATRAGRCPIPTRYHAAFTAAARDTGLPLAMLVAVGRVESNLQQAARSSAGARGILQVMPATAAELHLDSTDPNENVLAGARYLRLMLDRYKSPDLALAAYNGGPTAVDDAGGAPSQETITYAANVNRVWRSLRQAC